MEKPRVTEIKVRMDCNGCVQKIKRALHGITGVCDLYVDFPQQKITIIGWADPEHIVKAIKKTRKGAVICLHTEQTDQSIEPEPEGGSADGEAPAPESTNPPAEPPHTESEPPKEPPQPENPPPEAKPSPESAGPTTNQSSKPSEPKDEEIHVIYRYPPDNGYRYTYGHNPGYSSQWNTYHANPGFRGEPYQPYHGNPGFQEEPFQPPQPYPGNPGFRGEQSQPPYPGNPGFRGEQSQPPQPYPGSPGFRGEPFPQAQPVYVNHSYNTYKPSPYVTEYAHPRAPPSHYSQYTRPDYFSQETRDYIYNTYRPSPYVTEYVSPRPPPSYYSHYSRPDTFNQEYYSGNHGNGNITSIFSEENPNACRIA